MDVVGAGYYDLMCVCSSLSTRLDSKLHTDTHTHRVAIWCTDHVHVNGHDRTIFVILAKHCTRLPDDGSSVIRNILEYFQIFYNFLLWILQICI